MGLAALLALQALAPTIAQTMREPAAEAVIRWMSLGCLLQAAAAPATHLLTRALDFRSLGLIQLLSYLVGYGLVGLPLAWNQAGVDALVSAWLVHLALVAAASLIVRPHPFKPLLWYVPAREMLGVGQAVFMTNWVNWTLNHLDRLFVGRLLGTWSLGLYNVAYNLANIPSQILLGALQPAFVAAGAQMRAEPGRLATPAQFRPFPTPSGAGSCRVGSIGERHHSRIVRMTLRLGRRTRPAARDRLPPQPLLRGSSASPLPPVDRFRPPARMRASGERLCHRRPPKAQALAPPQRAERSGTQD